MNPVKTIINAMKPATWLPAVGRYIPLRHRYVLTRGNRLRLRYSVPMIAAGLALSVTVAVQSGAGPMFYQGSAAVYQMAAAGDIYGPETKLSISQKRLNRYAQNEGQDEGIVLASYAPEPAPQPREETLVIGKGDTLAGVLQQAGVPAGEALSAVKAMEEYYDPRHIRPGQQIRVKFEPKEESGFDFAEMHMDLDVLRSLSLRRTPEHAFEPSVQEKDVQTVRYAKTADIEVSLYGSAQKAGIPASVVADAIRIFSWDVDFQRDIRRGDTIDVMYEQVETEEGLKVKTGDILYARLNISGHEIPVYRYEHEDGNVDYYTINGVSVRKALLTTPVDGARVSSGFGQRKHPVLGYTKMHKGMDFAAPRGTPIYAAGDGTVERANRYSSYGNYIRIRHNNSVKTAYAHLDRFGKGIAAGSRVKQGQVIGYIGTTGRSTGPHLHYEVLMDGVQVNPKSVKMQHGDKLTGTTLAAFKQHANRINREYAALTGSTKVALRNLADKVSLR